MNTLSLLHSGRVPARRWLPAFVPLAPLLGLIAAGGLGSPLSRADVLTYRNDPLRTALNAGEKVLAPANVDSTHFGRLFTLSVDGKVDAQPLTVANLAVPGQGLRNVLFVATENDSVYAFDADSGAPFWHVSVLSPGETPSDPRSCDQVTPTIGITATPVIDPAAGAHGALYLVAMSKDAAGSYHQRLHALDLTTGAEILGGPTEITAMFPGAGPGGNGSEVFFAPGQYEDRCALLLVNGLIYTSWASHCDIAPYTSWIIGYNAATLQPAFVWNGDPNGAPKSSFLDDGSGSAFWNSGAGPAADAAGNVYHLSGNGPFDPTLDANGFPANGDYGDTFLKLRPASGATLQVVDYFTPSNQQDDANGDVDLGSGGAVVLPDVLDAANGVHHLAAGAGKDGHLYLVDRDNLGKFNPAGNQIYQDLAGALPGGEWATGAYFNGVLYYGPQGHPLRAFPFANGKLPATAASLSATSFRYPGTSPVVSANGTTNGIVWGYENGNPAVLHAYDATDLTRELYNSNQAAGGRDQFGAGNKFITTTVANGKVYAGTTSGVGVFGLLQAVPEYGQGFNPVGVTLNGSAALRGSALQLTDGQGNEAGSAFFATPVNVQAFATEFDFQLVNPSADGITFTVQNAGPTALGSLGGGLGYAGIARSVAIKFDLYDNAGEGTNSVGLYTDGAAPFVPATSLQGKGIDLHSGHPFHVRLVYDGTALTVSLTDRTNPALTASVEYPVDIPGTVGGATAYVGFTGGTGGLAAVQQITDWSYAPTFAPLPAAAARFAARQLPVAGSGAGTRGALTWPGFPSGSGDLYVANGPGSYVDYQVNVPAAGNYLVRVSAKRNNLRSTWQLAVNGSNVGAVQDEYAATDTYDVLSVGTVTLPAGTATFRFTATGKNVASTAYKISLGVISLVPQP